MLSIYYSSRYKRYKISNTDKLRRASTHPTYTKRCKRFFLYIFCFGLLDKITKIDIVC